jgi:acyl carrier protein/GNAT superfamily N-acetyltransferase
MIDEIEQPATERADGGQATAEQPTAEPPTAEPPTVEPPTAEPPTAEPPTVEPPTVEPPTAEPPTAEPVDVEREILRIVREDLLLGTDRPIALDQTLGDLGLDSLGVVQLVTAIDARFGVDLTDDVLIAAAPVTLGEIARFVGAAPPAGAAPPTPTSPPSAPDPLASPPLVHRIEVLEQRWAGRNLAMRGAWSMLRRSWPLARKVFVPPARYVFLSRCLCDPPLPDVQLPSGVELRAYRPEDRQALDGLWPAFLVGPAGRAFDSWLKEGAWADVAVDGQRVVGLVVQSAAGERRRIVLRPERKATWGLYLREAPDARGRGIGLALLRFSLAEAATRGFQENLTLVWRENAPMLAATTQLLGYRPIGRTTRTHVLGRTLFSWQIEDRSGRGSRIHL